MCKTARARLFDAEYGAYKGHFSYAIETLLRLRGQVGFEEAARRHKVSYAHIHEGDIPRHGRWQITSVFWPQIDRTGLE